MKLKNLTFYSIILAVIFSSFSCSQKEQIQDSNQPNVVLIFVDDMGYGDLGCYGHPNIKTPNIDNMADEGIRFTSFYAVAPVCTPSRAGLLTGRYPIRSIPTNCGPSSPEKGMPVSEITIANILKDEGYNTTAIGKWHLGQAKRFLPTSRGFDSFYGLPYSNDMILPWCPWLTENDTLFMYENEKPVKAIGFNQDDLIVDYTKKAVEFIEAQKNEPFFLYLAHAMPHLPISTADEFRGKSDGGLYGDVVETLDWSVGQILATLKEQGLDNNTLVIFTSDNGPWQNLPKRMLQKGVEPWHGGTAGPLRGAKATTYEGGFRVPGIVRWPGIIPKKQVTTEIATTMDLFSTIVEVAGAELPTDRKIDGHNILPLLKGKAKSPTKKLYYFNGKKAEGIRKGEWKLRITEAEGVQLFNLKDDAGEKYNRAEDNWEVVQKLYSDLKKFTEKTKGEILDLKI
jgi:arylsulfatase A-like enzyme